MVHKHDISEEDVGLSTTGISSEIISSDIFEEDTAKASIDNDFETLFGEEHVARSTRFSRYFSREGLPTKRISGRSSSEMSSDVSEKDVRPPIIFSRKPRVASPKPIDNSIEKRRRDKDVWRPAKRVAETETNNNTEKTFCARCKNIDWERIKNQDWPYKSKIIGPLPETHDQLRTSDCSICNILATTKPAEMDSNVCSLRIYSMQDVFTPKPEFRSKLDDAWMLGVWSMRHGIEPVKGGYVSVRNIDGETGAFGRHWEFDPDRIDYHAVMDCISFCKSDPSHKVSCSTKDYGSLTTLKLIDCHTRAIVSPSKRRSYVALSYVWGNADAFSKNSNKQSFPKVVEDSIKVTIDLGFQYLWVDKYCIDQTSQTHIKNQIQQMDKIYSGAEITLIAAAGEDSNYGLPGVNGTTREPQQQVMFKNTKLTQVFPQPAWKVHSSKWATRAWTYQEGFLSKRRLIFTDQQVVYLCNGMCKAETVQIPLEYLDSSATDMSSFSDMIPRGGGGGAASGLASPDSYESDENEAMGWQPEIKSALGYIKEYSCRELSYESDILNAFQGIFNTLRENKTPIYHIWGVPYMQYRGSSQYDASILDQIALHWYHDKWSRRRPGFPSWSWMGWVGPIKIDAEPTEGIKILPKGTEVMVNGAFPLTLYEYVHGTFKDKQLHTAELSQTLNVTAYVVKICFETINHSKHSEFTISQYIHDEVENNDHSPPIAGSRPSTTKHVAQSLLPRRGILRLDEDVETGSSMKEGKSIFTGLAFTNRGAAFHWGSMQMLIVNKAKEGFYERMGVVTNIITPLMKAEFEGMVKVTVELR